MAKKKENLKPNGFAWWIYRTYSAIAMKLKFNVKYDREVFNNRDKKEGCIVLYNHACNSDHFISTAFFGKTRVNYVITKRFMFFPPIRFVLNLVKAIHRDQFKNDTSSILKMRRVIEQGGIIAIAPAGQVSINGEMPEVNPIIVKLLKMCKADVYTLQTFGSYLAQPKWALNKRKYPITVKCVKTLSKEEVKSLDADACYEKIVKDLNINDRINQKELMFEIKGKGKALGLENILYICPKCGKKYTIRTNNDEIICDDCGNTVVYNKYGFLEGKGENYVLMKDEALWCNYQKHQIMEEIKAKTYYLESNVAFYTNPNKEFKLEHVGDGKLIFDIDSLKYIGTKCGKEYVKEFNLKVAVQLPFVPAVRFNIPDEEGMLEFVPENKREVMEWVQAIAAYQQVKLEEEQDANN